MPEEEYREKEIKKRILVGEYPHGSTHVPGGDPIPGGGGGGPTEEYIQAMIDAAVAAAVAELVTQATYNGHTHNYRKPTQLGADGVGNYASPVRVDIVDDGEVNVTDANKVATIGIRVSIQATEAPN